MLHITRTDIRKKNLPRAVAVSYWPLHRDFTVVFEDKEVVPRSVFGVQKQQKKDIKILQRYALFFSWRDNPPVGLALLIHEVCFFYEGWNFNSGNYLFTTDTK